jgi:hypothetical protein
MEQEPIFPQIPPISHGEPGASATGDDAHTARRRPCHWLGWVSLLGMCLLLIGYFLFRATPQDGHAQNLGDQKTSVLAGKRGMPTFVGWDKPRPPDLAIVVSGQMYGYVQPCGCSSPQKGGLARRYNFIQSLKDKGWQVTAVDLGEIAQASGPQQLLKYGVSMKALRLMGYGAVGIGKNEFLMPLTDALAQHSINVAQPRPVATNLAETDKTELFYQLNVRKGEIIKAGGVTAGVLGVTGDEIAKTVMASLPPNEKDIKFLDKDRSLSSALAVLAARKVDLGILFYQGHEKEAMKCAELLHQGGAQSPVHVVLCQTEDEEPPAFPRKSPQAPNTLIITIGHKGRYVGVVGAWKTAKGVDLKYQLVAMDPEFETKKGKEKDNPVMALMEKYAEEVRDGNYLARYPRGNHEVQIEHKGAAYVGSERCGDCHPHAFKIWQESRHAQAFQTLVNAQNPRLRQFDGECVVCHTVGFKYHTGYFNPPRESPPKQVEKHNRKLLNVGCESCHGPGSEHVNNPNNQQLYRLINPYRPSPRELNPATSAQDKTMLSKQRVLRVDGMCQQCHDSENDVNWPGFHEKWGLIAHPTPKKGAEGAAGK